MNNKKRKGFFPNRNYLVLFRPLDGYFDQIHNEREENNELFLVRFSFMAEVIFNWVVNLLLLL